MHRSSQQQQQQKQQQASIPRRMSKQQQKQPILPPSSSSRRWSAAAMALRRRWCLLLQQPRSHPQQPQPLQYHHRHHHDVQRMNRCLWLSSSSSSSSVRIILFQIVAMIVITGLGIQRILVVVQRQPLAFILADADHQGEQQYNYHQNTQQQQQQRMRQIAKAVTTTTSATATIISHDAWDEFLQQFQTSIGSSKVNHWLPVVIHRDFHSNQQQLLPQSQQQHQPLLPYQLWFRKDHVYQLAGNKRMNAFVQMMLRALLQLQQQQQEPQLGAVTTTTTTNDHRVVSSTSQNDSSYHNNWTPAATFIATPTTVTIPLLLGIGDHHECASRFPRFSWCTTPQDDNGDDLNLCQTFAIPSYNLYLKSPDKSIILANSHQRRSSNNNNDSGDNNNKLRQQQLIQYYHQRQEARYPWSKKKRLAVWRGTPTGRVSKVLVAAAASRTNQSNNDKNNNNDDDSWKWIPRVHLVQHSIQYPHVLDAAFVSTKQFDAVYTKHQVQALRQQSKFASPISLQDMQRYRAIVDIDGNAWSSRFGELLCLNSVIIKVQPNNKNYFYDELIPWVHYVPVRSDQSDLIDKIQWVMSNDTLAQSIVHHANEWCWLRLYRQGMVNDLSRKIQSYAQSLGLDETVNDTNHKTRWHQWQDIWNNLLASTTKTSTSSSNSGNHEQQPNPKLPRIVMVPIQPNQWLGISFWNVSWRIAKPFYLLLQWMGWE